MVLAFGDSLTNGYGVASSLSYPKQFEKKTGLKVFNAGIDGEFSKEGLGRLPSLLKDDVELVILCHGGNDIVNQHPYNELKKNLLAMVQLIQQKNIKVLLVAVPDYFHSGFGMCDVYTEVAQETAALFECDVLRHINIDRSLKGDHIHPNAKGYEMMADAFVDILEL